MSQNSAIEWTNHTFNPWWGCTKVSAGCANCYAERFAERTGHRVWGNLAGRRIMSDDTWDGPLKWNETARRANRIDKVFCGSMCDVMEDRHDLEAPRARLFSLIERTTSLWWQLLTKRPKNFDAFLPSSWKSAPPINVMIGVSVEDQCAYDERVPVLLNTPARCRFVSYEPMLGMVDLGAHAGAIDWIILGGESGPGFRPCEINWFDVVYLQTRAAHVACFVKQDCGSRPAMRGRLSEHLWNVKEFPRMR